MLAEQGKRNVLLIEADLHHPTLTEQLGIEQRAGLAECLEHGLNPASVLRRLEPLAWYLMPAGKPHCNPTELLQTEALAGVLQGLAHNFDWILIDSPPVIPLTDALSLARRPTPLYWSPGTDARRWKLSKRPSPSSAGSVCLALSLMPWMV